MTEHIDVLREVTFLKPLDPAEIASFASSVHEVTFAPGTRFITEGQMDEDAFVIVEGEAEVSVRDVRVRRLHRGDVVGEMAAIASHRRTASVTAVTQVRALVLTGEFLRDLMRDHPSVAAVLAREMSSRASG